MTQENATALEVKNIVKRFGTNEVLKGVSLTAHRGDVISVIGSSGSGKSTWLRCMNLLEQPHEGEIVLRGEPLKLKRDRDGSLTAVDHKALERFRSRLSMVFQHFNLWSHMTVIQNVIEAPMHVLGLSRDEAVARAENYLTRVGVIHRKDFFPAHLSGGEQQRVAIARALRVMRDLAGEGRTMIVVTHEMGFAREVSNRVVFLHKGLIEEEGDPKVVLANPKSERLRQFLSGSLK
jgi:arginine/ornithine transport system ATP-binding protein